MNLVKDFVRFCTDKRYRFDILSSKGFFDDWSDEKYIKHKFKLIMGYNLNLENPKTFNEKLQWLKLYDRNPLYTVMADKYKAKEYMASIVDSRYIIPTLGVWDNPNDIDFNQLPNKFVLKCNHNSGLGMYICKDKKDLDIKKIRKRLAKGLKQDFYLTNREWPYKDIPHKIVAEEYLGDNLQDYRVYCFNGKPKLIYSYTNESNEEGSKPEPTYCDIYSPQWEPVPFRQKCPPRGNITRPIHLEKMLEISSILSKGIPHLRVDFYETDKLYIGELTFFAGGGFSVFYPDEWNRILGSWLNLPKL